MCTHESCVGFSFLMNSHSLQVTCPLDRRWNITQFQSRSARSIIGIKRLLVRRNKAIGSYWTSPVSGLAMIWNTCCCSWFSFEWFNVCCCSHLSQNVTDGQWMQSNRKPCTSSWQKSQLKERIIHMNELSLVIVYHLLDTFMHNHLIPFGAWKVICHLFWPCAIHRHVASRCRPVEIPTTAGLLVASMIVSTA